MHPHNFMHCCHFCGTGIAEYDGAVIPGQAMIVALDRGYSPTLCPNWPTLNQRVRLAQERENPGTPVGDEAVLTYLNGSLRGPDKAWRLCNTCCSTLGPYLPPAPRRNEAEETLKSLQYVLPTNATLLSIFAGYAGLFSVLLLPAPVALVLGILALRQIRSRRKMGQDIGGTGRAVFAIIMGGLFTIQLGLFLVLVVAGAFS